MVVGSVVNTFLDAFQAESVYFTVDGQILESGHVIYDFAILRGHHIVITPERLSVASHHIFESIFVVRSILGILRSGRKINRIALRFLSAIGEGLQNRLLCAILDSDRIGLGRIEEGNQNITLQVFTFLRESSTHVEVMV